MWERKYLERNRGFQEDAFSEVLKKAQADIDAANGIEVKKLVNDDPEEQEADLV